MEWQLKPPAEKRYYLLETGLWSDCKFVVGNENEIFSCHKLILCMASPVFEAMFYGEMAEREEFIKVDDIKPLIFKKMLEFVYTDRIVIRYLEEAWEICYAAKKYMIPSLVMMCVGFVLECLNPKTACKALEFGRFFDEKEVQKRAMKEIGKNINNILKEPCDPISEIQESTLLHILNQDGLEVDSELDLFRAVKRWAMTEFQRRNLNEENDCLYSVGVNAVKKVRFLTMSPDEFSIEPSRSLLLTEKESYAILMNICSSSCFPMPEGFTCSRVPRNKISSLDKYMIYIPINVAHDFIVTDVTSGTVNKISFEVSQDLYVMGIRVYSQTNPCLQILHGNKKIWNSYVIPYQYPPESNLSHCRNPCDEEDLGSCYTEDIIVILYGPENYCISKRRFTYNVLRNQPYDILLPTKTEIVSGKTYRFEVQHLVAGIYPFFKPTTMYSSKLLQVSFPRLENNINIPYCSDFCVADSIIFKYRKED